MFLKSKPFLPEEEKKLIIKRLDKNNPYPAKVKTFIQTKYPVYISPVIYGLGSNKMINKVQIKAFSNARVLSEMEFVKNPLISDERVFIQELTFTIKNIDSDQKLIKWDQIASRLVSRYGKPQVSGDDVYIKDWKSGQINTFKENIWRDNNFMIIQTGLKRRCRWDQGVPAKKIYEVQCRKR